LSVCSECNNDSSCTHCLDTTRTAPECACYEGTFDLEGVCTNCNSKCLSCSNHNTCKVCKENTRDLPNCDCSEGYYDDAGTCKPYSKCSELQFKDEKTESCRTCDISCSTCPEDENSRCLPHC